MAAKMTHEEIEEKLTAVLEKMERGSIIEKFKKEVPFELVRVGMLAAAMFTSYKLLERDVSDLKAGVPKLADKMIELSVQQATTAQAVLYISHRVDKLEESKPAAGPEPTFPPRR